ncbi:MAG: damage-inducible protein CinA, partial [Flaviaesturariibacter sp.]|nr:damage-inducible protein CinA [Flaviaesturariibacter sp.]
LSMKEVTASIITIGDELLIGQTIDTNSAFIGQELNKIGVWLKRRIAVGDIREEILAALDQQSQDNDIIIITGGLGPTADDITKPALCDYFGAPLVVNEDALQNVTEIFAKLNKPLIDRNRRQAEVPQNCTVLPNRRGTAPGMWFEKDGVVYISLPGVPHEMKGLMLDSAIPKLGAHFSLPVIAHRTLLIAGKGESEIAELILEFESALPYFIKLAYLPAYGMIRMRLTGKGDEQKALEESLNQQFSQLKTLVAEWMVADEDISLPDAVSRLLKQKEKTVGTAESCTGGYIAQLLTAKAGSSAIYKGSVVAYANQVKQEVLDVSPSTLQQHGAVSEETVREMVAGALKSLKTDYAIATSGIMGPDGGTAEKPVGTVWVAVGNQHTTKAVKLTFRFDRSRNIELTAHNALNMLRKFVLEQEGE